MPSQMLETLLSALNAIQAMPFECPASMKAEVSKVLGDLPSAAQDQMKTGSPLTIKALAGLEGERLAKLVHRTVSLLSTTSLASRLGFRSVSVVLSVVSSASPTCASPLAVPPSLRARASRRRLLRASAVGPEARSAPHALAPQRLLSKGKRVCGWGA